MRFGVFASVLFHLAVAGAAFLSLPEGWRPDLKPDPYIPLELIIEAERDLTSSAPAASPDPAAVDEAEPDLPEETVEETPDPAPAEPERESVVEDVQPDPAAVVQETPPQPDPPNVKPKPKNDALDLDALSKLIDKERDDERAAAARETPSETVETADRARPAVGAGDRLTASDEAKMRAAVGRCWNASSIIGAPEPEKLIVVVEFELNRDGSLASQPRVANAMQINISGNRFWKVAEQSALRAVVSCAPYDFLPQERYQTWKEFKLNFDPSEMAGR